MKRKPTTMKARRAAMTKLASSLKTARDAARKVSAMLENDGFDAEALFIAGVAAKLDGHYDGAKSSMGVK